MSRRRAQDLSHSLFERKDRRRHKSGTDGHVGWVHARYLVKHCSWVCCAARCTTGRADETSGAPPRSALFSVAVRAPRGCAGGGGTIFLQVPPSELLNRPFFWCGVFRLFSLGLRPDGRCWWGVSTLGRVGLSTATRIFYRLHFLIWGHPFCNTQKLR